MKDVDIKSLFISFIGIIEDYHFMNFSDYHKIMVIAYYMSKELGLPREEIKDILIAAAVDDIGVCRNGEYIKKNSKGSKHELLGYSMLVGYEPLKNVSRLVLHHHINYQDVKSGKYAVEEIEFGSYVLRASHILLCMLDEVDNHFEPHLIDCSHQHEIHPDLLSVCEKLINDEAFIQHLETDKVSDLLEAVLMKDDFITSGDYFEEFVKMFSRVCDYKTHFTVYHSLLVANVAELLTSLLGYEKDVQYFVKMSGYLHDIGKISVTCDIFEKQNPLNDRDLKMIEQYKSISEDIFRRLNWKELFGVSDDTLFLLKRVIPFAEMLVAMQENRPHRQKKSATEIKGILKNEFNDEELIRLLNLHYESIVRRIHHVLAAEENFFPKMFIPSYLKDYSIVYK